MSMAIVINQGYYVLFVTDTRHVDETVDLATGAPSFTDGGRKVRDIGIGLMTGLGWSPLIDSVETQIVREQIASTGQITAVIHERRQRFLDWPGHSGMVRDCIDTWTYWILSWGTPTPDPRTGADGTLRLAIAHHRHDYQPQLVDSFIGFPYQSTPEQISEYQGLLEERIRPMTDASEFVSNLRYHSEMARDLVVAFSRINPYVSPSCQIGLHSLTYGIQVSDVAA